MLKPDEIEAAIEKWVPRVNGEYGLSDKNDISIAWFKKLIGTAEFVACPDYYLVYLIAPDMWGALEMHVVSFYILPQKRRALCLKVFKQILSIATQCGCARVVMGAHVGQRQRFNTFLCGLGFKAQTFIKEV